MDFACESDHLPSRMIEVEFRDGARGRMAPAALDLCLKHNQLRRFRRSGGWVFVGRDPIRRTPPDKAYSGPERRTASTSTRLS